MKTYYFTFENLTCAHCAGKIAEAVQKMNGVEFSSYNFAKSLLKIETKREDFDKIKDELILIVNKYEDGVKVVFNKNIEQSKVNKSKDEKKLKIEKGTLLKLIRIALSTILLIVGIFIKKENFWDLLIFGVPYLIIGYDVIFFAIKGIFKGNIFNEKVLMTVASIGALCLLEAIEAVLVLLLFQIGDMLEGIAVKRSRKSIGNTLNLRPDYAIKVVGEKEVRLSPEEVNMNDIIIVRTGEKIPADGIIIEGNAFLNTAMITGESVPKKYSLNDKVMSGSINENGLIKIKVTVPYSEGTVARITKLIDEAASKKSKSEKFIEKFAKYYTPIVFLMAVLVSTIPLIFGGVFSEWLKRALIFLVISCPCALVISVPLSFFGSIGGASKLGFLVKGADTVEMLSKVRTVVFDKTGTLTNGDFVVTKVVAKNGFSKEDVIKYSAYCESYSIHPIATSILNYYGEKIDKFELRTYNEIAGQGISVIAFDKKVLCGNEKLLNSNNIVFEKANEPFSTVYVAIDNVYAGYIVIRDRLKEDAAYTVQALKNMGIKTMMLTGDKKETALAVGNEVGIDEIKYELLPEDKVTYVERETKLNRTAFVGDGINDAPVIKIADVGVAMGGVGSDAAVMSADAVLMTDEPKKLVGGIKLAQKTARVVIFNIVFALAIKLTFMILGIFGIATMYEAVFGDVGVTLIAILNSLRTLNVNKINKDLEKAGVEIKNVFNESHSNEDSLNKGVDCNEHEHGKDCCGCAHCE